MVTVVVTATPGPTQTPIYVTEVQTVVVTATAETPATGTPAPATGSTTPLAGADGTGTTPGATASPPPATLKYDPPVLEAPVNQEVFASDVRPLLRWHAVPLAEDEYYEVTIERLWQNQPYYAGSEWLRESELLVPSFVLGTSDTNQYTWWVTIKRQTGTTSAGGRVGEPVSPPSEQRTFTWLRE